MSKTHNMQFKITYFYLSLTVILACVSLPFSVTAQNEDSLYFSFFKGEIEITDPNYTAKYNYMLTKLKRVYPYAIYAKQLFENYEKDIAELDKKKQIKKYGKTAHEKLIEDFEYVVRDMYISDGKVLMKLIHRETGNSVYDIIHKYRGKFKATWYSTMGKLFDQDLKSTYNPDKEDWLIERIVSEIEQGKHKVGNLKLITKEEFKEIKEQDKKRKKELKRKRKEKAKSEKKH
jgi:hypothetical protein